MKMFFILVTLYDGMIQTIHQQIHTNIVIILLCNRLNEKNRSMKRNLEKPVFFLKEYPCDGVKEIVHDKQVKKHVRLHEG